MTETTKHHSRVPNSIQLLSVGQIKEGDTVLVTFKNNRRPYDVKEVLNAGTSKEEILLDIEDNLYFITSMAIDGTSWAEDVCIQKVGATNTSHPERVPLSDEMIWWLCASCGNKCLAPAQSCPSTECQDGCPKPDYKPMRLQKSIHAGGKDWVLDATTGKGL